MGFGCWGGSDINKPDTVKVTEGSWEKALCKATVYKGPLDSACLGIYLINGVCHQSANLFLYAANTSLPLNASRPRGVLASHLFYSVYGVFEPGALLSSPTFFLTWLSLIYSNAYYKCCGASENLPPNFVHNWDTAGKNLPSNFIFAGLDETSLEYKIIKNNTIDIPNGFTVNNIVVSDMQIIIDHILQIPQHPALNTHMEILNEKNRLLTSYGLTKPEIEENGITLTDSDIKSLSNSMNKICIDLQDELKNQIGTQAYIQLNGDDQFYSPIDSDMAVATMRFSQNK